MSRPRSPHRDAALALVRSGMRLADIARQLGIPRSSVGKWAREAGVRHNRRHPPGAHAARPLRGVLALTAAELDAIERRPR